MANDNYTADRDAIAAKFEEVTRERDTAPHEESVRLAQALADERLVCHRHGCSGGQLKWGGVCGACDDGYTELTERAKLARAFLAAEARAEQAERERNEALKGTDYWQRKHAECIGVIDSLTKRLGNAENSAEQLLVRIEKLEAERDELRAAARPALTAEEREALAWACEVMSIQDLREASSFANMVERVLPTNEETDRWADAALRKLATSRTVRKLLGAGARAQASRRNRRPRQAHEEDNDNQRLIMIITVMNISEWPGG